MNTLNCRGRILDLRKPIVMGIINVNDDSFYAGSRHSTLDSVLLIAGNMMNEGAGILDIGGVSTRPNAEIISISKELERIIPAIEIVKENYPDAIISVDTFHSEVALKAIEAGASIINDISAGAYDNELPFVAQQFKCPYILMHMQGTPQTMQQDPQYNDVVLDILDFFIAKLAALKGMGLHDIIIDPGFGFGKTIDHNYQILNGLNIFNILDKPIMAGISRKGMLWKPLNSNPTDVLPATIAVNLVALQKGAKILRVHDVGATMQLIKTFDILRESKIH